MIGKMDAKKAALDELMQYLDQKDGEELGAVVKPPVEPGVEGDPIGAHEGGEEVVVAEAEGAAPEMSEEELAELIEALQAKVGA